MTFDPYPIYVVEGRGCYVVDVDGIERIDFINNYSSMIHGHCHPQIVEAIRRQAGKLIAVGAPTESEIDLAELVASRLPCVEQLRFCNSGTEAVMLAVRAARLFTGRSKIAKIEGAYHGGYDYEHVTLTFNDVEASRRVLETHKAELAGVIFDPIVGRMAFAEATPEYIRFVQEWTRANDALLILDEVFSFRIDLHGAQGKYRIDADLTTLGKIIGGGIAIGAIGGKKKVMQVFGDGSGYPRLPHHGTYNANPLAMAAGRVSMELLDAAAIARINALGDRLRNGLDKTFAEANVPAKAQGVGSMVAIVAAADFIARMHCELLNRGVLIMPRGAFVMSTPMTESEIDRTLAAVAECLSSAAVP